MTTDGEACKRHEHLRDHVDVPPYCSHCERERLRAALELATTTLVELIHKPPNRPKGEWITAKGITVERLCVKALAVAKNLGVLT